MLKCDNRVLHFNYAQRKQGIKTNVAYLGRYKPQKGANGGHTTALRLMMQSCSSVSNGIIALLMVGNQECAPGPLSSHYLFCTFCNSEGRSGGLNVSPAHEATRVDCCHQREQIWSPPTSFTRESERRQRGSVLICSKQTRIKTFQG